MSADFSIMFRHIVPQGGYTGGYIWGSTGVLPKFYIGFNVIAKVFRDSLIYSRMFQLCNIIAEVFLFFGFGAFL